MFLSPEDVLAIQPEIRRAIGGYLAVSERQAGLHIGVVGATEHEARENFKEALRSWAELRRLPDPYVL